VVGAQEAEAGTVSVRSRDRGELGVMPIAALIEIVKAEATPG
jgi:threonyl-tRNA synthetase